MRSTRCPRAWREGRRPGRPVCPRRAHAPLARQHLREPAIHVDELPDELSAQILERFLIESLARELPLAANESKQEVRHHASRRVGILGHAALFEKPLESLEIL